MNESFLWTEPPRWTKESVILCGRSLWGVCGRSLWDHLGAQNFFFSLLWMEHLRCPWAEPLRWNNFMFLWVESVGEISRCIRFVCGWSLWGACGCRWSLWDVWKLVLLWAEPLRCTKKMFCFILWYLFYFKPETSKTLTVAAAVVGLLLLFSVSKLPMSSERDNASSLLLLTIRGVSVEEKTKQNRQQSQQRTSLNTEPINRLYLDSLQHLFIDLMIHWFT